MSRGLQILLGGLVVTAVAVIGLVVWVGVSIWRISEPSGELADADKSVKALVVQGCRYEKSNFSWFADDLFDQTQEPEPNFEQMWTCDEPSRAFANSAARFAGPLRDADYQLNSAVDSIVVAENHSVHVEAKPNLDNPSSVHVWIWLPSNSG